MSSKNDKKFRKMHKNSMLLLAGEELRKLYHKTSMERKLFMFIASLEAFVIIVIFILWKG